MSPWPCTLVFAGLLALPAAAAGERPDPAAVMKYDATRHAAADISRAVAAARSSGKRVLLNIGGDWCVDFLAAP